MRQGSKSKRYGKKPVRRLQSGAEKEEEKALKIVQITATNTAYMPAMLTYLLNTYTEHEATLLQAHSFIFGNPLNVPTTRVIDEIIATLDAADVIHFHGNQVFDRRRFLGIKLNPYYKKPFVLHYHGTPQRERASRFQRACCLLVSTPEMLPLFPNAIFFPNIIDETHEIYQQRADYAGKIRVCHHFSLHQPLKDTVWFDRAREAIAGNGSDIEFAMIPRANLAAALAARAQHDAVFDHLQGYYGLVSIEGMAQGLCVVNGCSEHTKRALTEFFGEMPPFVVTTRQRFIETLQRLTREEVNGRGRRGVEFMRSKWSGAKLVHRIVDIYKGL